jgi:glycosyltransferase involved in cell wall biosynthesis
MTPNHPRVVMVNNSAETFTPSASGAIATWIWEVARAAQETGTTLTVLTGRAQESPYPWPDLRVLGPVIRPLGRPAILAERVVRRLLGWPTLRRWAYAHRVRRSLRDIPAGSLIVCHNDPELATLLARSLTGVRVVHWFHNPILATDRWRRRYRKAPLRSVAVSRAVARAVETLYVLGPLTVDSVLNGVDLERFRPPATPPSGPPVISFAGRTGIEKGLDVLMTACLSLAPGRAFSLQIVGTNHWGHQTDDDYQQQLNALTRRLNDAGIVVARLGHVTRDALPSALQACHIHVVPSRWDEPASLSILEGMAIGLASVATATGGSPELLGEAGALIPRDDPEALAVALTDLLDDAGHCHRRGEDARRRAEAFPWSVVWQRISAFTTPWP